MKEKNSYRLAVIALSIGLIGLFMYASKYFFGKTESKISTSSNEPLVAERVIDSSDPEKTYLHDTQNGESFGIAKRIYSNGTFIHTINASISTDSKDSKYSVWLIKPGSDEKILINDAVKIEGEYISIYQTSEDLRAYTRIQIKEISPEGRVVLEGSY